jgi:F-type H+-transporting ATPase subunit gamma
MPILDEVVKMYTGHEHGDIGQVNLITTDFVSTVAQQVELRQLLPVVVPEKTGPRGDAEMEPEPEDLVDFAIRRVLEAELVQAILEARASEQAARMLAMMNATDNADDIISDLTLVYNNERQSGITQEISEITGGAEAITKA